MQNNDIHKFLQGFRVYGDINDKNVISQGSIQCKSGKWLIPNDKYPEFLKHINNELERNPKRQMHFLELPSIKSNMVKIDVDLRFRATEDEIKSRNNLKRHYDDEFIEILINTIAENIKDIINIKDNYNIYVQEKQEPRITHENTIKDGIHIIIPEIVMSNNALFNLRDKIINCENLNDKIKSINNLTEIKDVIDKRIIYPNAWYVYGCGKPEDDGKYYIVSKVYKVMKKNDGYILKKTQSNKSLQDFINMFSNFGKEENVEYTVELEDFDDTQTKITFGNKDKENLLRSYTQNQHNFRRICSLTAIEIKAYLNCLKKERADDYTDWWRVGLCLFNMDDRNYQVWCNWSSQSDKYDENSCFKMWYSEYPKGAKYNLGFNKLREMSKQDNPEEYKKIFDINKKNFFEKWIFAHTKETHMAKVLSVNTLSEFIKTYIKDYASFNVACADPGASSTWYKFEKHKWSVDCAGNKIYMLMTDELERELKIIHEELKKKVFKSMQEEEQETGSSANQHNDQDDDEGNSIHSYQRHIRDDREARNNVEEQKAKHVSNQINKLCLEKCGQIIQFISTPQNKKKIIEELSHKCYDEEFYKNLNENHNVFVCNNGVLDTQACVFRVGDPQDMMTISSNISFPKNVDSLEAQEHLHAIQDWLDRILPEDEVQDYVLNSFACKLSGISLGEKFHIFTGSGANGKSQFFKLIKKVFGEYYDTFDNCLLNTPKGNPNGPSPAIAKLKGIRVAVTTEPKSGQPFESDKVKELVSGDELTGRHLNKDPISFIPQYMMILMCNDIPRNESTDDGFWRKIFIVPCKAKFVSKDEDMYKLNDPVKFPYHFIAEHQDHLYGDWAPYFLYMLFERYKVLKRNNYKYPVPEQVKMAIKEYQDEASTYSDYFRTRIEEAPGYKISSNELYADFQLYVGRDFKTQKSFFLKQIERFIGKPKGRNKDFVNFKIHGTSGNLIEDNDDESN
jgi:P4 family phage/plasmid primase-like protien